MLILAGSDLKRTRGHDDFQGNINLKICRVPERRGMFGNVFYIKSMAEKKSYTPPHSNIVVPLILFCCRFEKTKGKGKTNQLFLTTPENLEV